MTRNSKKSTGSADLIGARELKDVLQALARRAARTAENLDKETFAWQEDMPYSTTDSAVAGRAAGFEAFGACQSSVSAI